MANTTGKKFGGRQKGSSNQITNKTKQVITELIEGNLNRLKQDLDELQPKERLQVITGLLRYILPTLRAQEVSVTTTDEMPTWVASIMDGSYSSEE